MKFFLVFLSSKIELVEELEFFNNLVTFRLENCFNAQKIYSYNYNFVVFDFFWIVILQGTYNRVCFNAHQFKAICNKYGLWGFTWLNFNLRFLTMRIDFTQKSKSTNGLLDWSKSHYFDFGFSVPEVSDHLKLLLKPTKLWSESSR